MVIHMCTTKLYCIGTKSHFGVRPSFYPLVYDQAFSNYVYDHVFLLQSSMFPAYWILITSGKSSECHEGVGNSIRARASELTFWQRQNCTTPVFQAVPQHQR